MNLKNYGRPNLQNLNNKKIIHRLKQNILTDGPRCKKFEELISKKVGAKYTVVCNNGTSALFMAILATRKKKITAIIPNINFVASSSILSLIGAKIFLCDVDPSTGMVNAKNFSECLKAAIKKKYKPNLFIPIHYAGLVCDLKNIKKICKKNNIIIIEDGCHSFGSQYKEDRKIQMVGNSKYSECCTFSFHPVKNITSIEGGAVTTNNKKIYKKLKLIKSHALKTTYIDEPYKLMLPSLNFRLGETNAEIGIDQISHFSYFKKKRSEIVNFYIDNLDIFKKNLNFLNFKKSKNFWHLFVIILKGKLMMKKKKFMEYLRKNNIGTQIHYKPMHYHKVYKKNIIFSQNKNADKFYKSQLTLPLHTKMSFKDILFIKKKIMKFLIKEKISY